MGAIGSGKIATDKTDKTLTVNSVRLWLVSSPVWICFASSKLVEVKYVIPEADNRRE